MREEQRVFGGEAMLLRPFWEADRPIVRSTFLASMHGHTKGIRGYWTAARPVVDYLIDHCTIVVACSPAEPAAVLGWAAGIHGHPLWAYVPIDLRGIGLGKALLELVK